MCGGWVRQLPVGQGPYRVWNQFSEPCQQKEYTLGISETSCKPCDSQPKIKPLVMQMVGMCCL